MTVELIVVVWLLGVGLLATELFVSGLIAGAIGTLCVVGSVVAMFAEGGALYGGGLTLASVALAGIAVPLGMRRVAQKHVLSADAGFVGTDDRSDLVGLSGVAATLLRPGGFATIGGHRIDVVTAGELIESGTEVEVVAVEGNRVEVRAVRAATK